MYYFPQPDGSTAMATMELLDNCGEGPRPSKIGTYELVGYSKHSVSNKDDSSFEKTERLLCGIFTALGNYCSHAELNPKETSEIPSDNCETRYVIFDQFSDEAKPLKIGKRLHGLLVCIAIHPSELQFARSQGSDALFELLRNKGFYPFSDLDRPPVA